MELLGWAGWKARCTPDSSAYGAKMSEAVGNADLQKIVNLLIAACDKTTFDWKSEISFFIVESPSTPSTGSGTAGTPNSE